MEGHHIRLLSWLLVLSGSVQSMPTDTAGTNTSVTHGGSTHLSTTAITKTTTIDYDLADLDEQRVDTNSRGHPADPSDQGQGDSNVADISFLGDSGASGNVAATDVNRDSGAGDLTIDSLIQTGTDIGGSKSSNDMNDIQRSSGQKNGVTMATPTDSAGVDVSGTDGFSSEQQMGPSDVSIERQDMSASAVSAETVGQSDVSIESPNVSQGDSSIEGQDKSSGHGESLGSLSTEGKDQVSGTSVSTENTGPTSLGDLSAENKVQSSSTEGQNQSQGGFSTGSEVQVSGESLGDGSTEVNLQTQGVDSQQDTSAQTGSGGSNEGQGQRSWSSTESRETSAVVNSDSVLDRCFNQGVETVSSSCTDLDCKVCKLVRVLKDTCQSYFPAECYGSNAASFSTERPFSAQLSEESNDKESEEETFGISNTFSDAESSPVLNEAMVIIKDLCPSVCSVGGSGESTENLSLGGRSSQQGSNTDSGGGEGSQASREGASGDTGSQEAPGSRGGGSWTSGSGSGEGGVSRHSGGKSSTGDQSGGNSVGNGNDSRANDRQGSHGGRSSSSNGNSNGDGRGGGDNAVSTQSGGMSDGELEGNEEFGSPEEAWLRYHGSSEMNSATSLGDNDNELENDGEGEN